MRGHIIKRGENSYSVVIRRGKDPITGKYLQSWFTVKGSSQDAEKKRTELLHQLDNGVFMKPSKTALAEYLEKWLKDYAWANLAPRTAEGYEHIIRRHIIPSIGKIPLSSLKPEHLQSYYAKKLKEGRCDGKGGLSAKTVRHHHITLHDALQTAVKWGLLITNPADAVTAPKIQRKEMQTWNEDDIKHFLIVTKTSEYYPIFYLALFTGMRRSEILALRWCDVDAIYSQVYVSRSLHHLRDGSIVFRQPKTAKSNRTIALPPSTSLMLKDYQVSQNGLHLLNGKALTNESLIFCHIDGSPLLPDTVTHAWIKLVRRYGLKSIRLHDARHSHASLMLKQGIHPKIVQERLGHSSIQITLDTYSHVAPGMQEAAAVRFDEAIKVMNHT
jgi:integrase